MSAFTAMRVAVYNTPPIPENPLTPLLEEKGEPWPDWADCFTVVVKVDKFDLEMILHCYDKDNNRAPWGLPTAAYARYGSVTMGEEWWKDVLWTLYMCHKHRVLKARGEWKDSADLPPHVRSSAGVLE